jgi:hypothetical protein
MELNGVTANGLYGDSRERSQSETSDNALIFSNESISSALSAVSGAGSVSSVDSHDTCVNIVLKNGAPPKPDDDGTSKTPKSDGGLPETDAEKSIPVVTVLTPGRGKKVFLVAKVDEENPPTDKDEVESPVKDLPLAALFKPDKADGTSERPVFFLPEDESEEKPSPSRIRKDSLTKRKKSHDDTGRAVSPGAKRKDSKTAVNIGKGHSPSGHRKNSLIRKISIESSPARRRSKDDSVKPRNRSGTTESTESVERDQLLELPKIMKNRTRFGHRRVSYDDHVVKIPSDDEGHDNVFEEEKPLSGQEDEDDMDEVSHFVNILFISDFFQINPNKRAQDDVIPTR